MKFLYDIPASFWGLFRSVNRDIYIEALLVISEEYQYNNYFLSRETCVQLLSDMYSEHRFRMEREDLETDEEAQEAIVTEMEMDTTAIDDYVSELMMETEE